MRRLIAIATLGLALGFSSLSFASEYMALYTKPVAKSEVRTEAIGGSVERDFMSFYISSKTANTSASLTAKQKSDDGYISVFGVPAPLSPRG